MAIRSSQYFMFNNRSSVDFGIINVNVSSGMLEEPFVTNREILETKVRGRDVPYFHGIEKSPLEFDVTFAFEDTFDSDKIREVARWLTEPSYYAPLIFSENPNRIYYALVANESQLIHNGLGQGYITLHFRCNSPYSFSQVYTSPVYDFSSNDANGKSVQYTNYGDLPVAPIIKVEIVSGSTFKIVNISDGGKKLEFTGLSTSEQLVIDCEEEEIESNVTYRYDKITSDSVYLNFNRGVSNLQVYGNIKLQFISQFIQIQG